MKNVFYCLIAVMCLLVTGCAQTHYAWNGYDQKLYNHYRSPDGGDKFSAELKEIIADNETSGRVPPGIFAEYGYTLYEKGQFSEAIEYFKKEQAKWPESNVLMTKMISNSQQRLKQNENKKIEATSALEKLKVTL
ncbi:MAG: DUF4810 domain-containing protein [Desulfocapsaceae bacterium]|jgi:hypothetical protein|nr:DUF4810 domain-containing protein [Desulfocapsaceae bacterium]